MGRRGSKSKASSSLALVGAMEVSMGAVSGPHTLKELCSALELEVPDHVVDWINSGNKKNGRDRLRQKLLCKTVTQYAQCVQKVRQGCHSMQDCRDEIVKAEANLVMLNLKSHALQQAKNAKKKASVEEEKDEVKQSAPTIVDIDKVKTIMMSKKLPTIKEGQESDTEMETLSDDSWNTSIQESGSQDEDEDSKSADRSPNNGSATDDVPTEYISSVYAQALPFFHDETGKPTLCVRDGKDLKRIKKHMVKSLLNQPELQRVLQASPLFREVKEMYMEKNKTSKGSDLCTKTKGCRCDLHKDAHAACVETMVNSFVNHFVAIETLGGAAPFQHQYETQKKKKQALEGN